MQILFPKCPADRVVGRLVVLLLGLVGVIAAEARAADDVIVYALKQWEGTYVTSNTDASKNSACSGAIYCLRVGSGESTKIASPGTESNNPICSRDGKWIYFQARDNGLWDIYRCRPDGTELTNLTRANEFNKGCECFGMRLSLDDRKLIYTRHDGTNGKTAVMDADGSDPHLVETDAAYFYMGALNPDGTKAVFADAKKNYTLMVSQLSSHALTVLVPSSPAFKCIVPQFTPDGKTIVFLKIKDDLDNTTGDVFSVDVAGKSVHQLTKDNHYHTFFIGPHDEHGSSDSPDISFDGRRIAYIARVDGVPQVFSMNLDGSAKKQLTTRPTACGRVKWSPDGTRIAFVSFEGDYPQLFVVDAKGGEPKKLTDIKGAVYFHNWLPQQAEKATGPKG